MEIAAVRLKNLEALIRAAGSMAALSGRTGISPAYLSQLKTGHRLMGSGVSRKIEEALRLPRGILDTLHTWDGFRPMQPIQHGVYDLPETDLMRRLATSTRNAREHGLPDYLSYHVDVPTYRNANSGSATFDQSLDAPFKTVSFARSYLRSLGVSGNTTALCLFFADSDKMMPTINPGDAILIDMAINAYAGDGIYLVRQAGAVQICRIQLQGDQLAIKSDNPQYDTWLTPCNSAQTIQILGRAHASLPISAAKRFS